MSNELTTQQNFDLASLPQNPNATLASFKENIQANSYLSYMKLYGSNTTEVKERKVPVGHYGFVTNQTITDVGETVVGIPFSWRWKAVDSRDGGYLVYYNSDSEQFKAVKALSTVKDSRCMYGPEFLIWLPDHQTFVAYHMNNESARRESENVLAMLGQLCLFSSRLASSKKYKWEAPVVTGCSTPASNLPDPADLTRVVGSFVSPKDSEASNASEQQTEAVTTDRR